MVFSLYKNVKRLIQSRSWPNMQFYAVYWYFMNLSLSARKMYSTKLPEMSDGEASYFWRHENFASSLLPSAKKATRNNLSQNLRRGSP